MVSTYLLVSHLQYSQKARLISALLPRSGKEKEYSKASTFVKFDYFHTIQYFQFGKRQCTIKEVQLRFWSNNWIIFFTDKLGCVTYIQKARVLRVRTPPICLIFRQNLGCECVNHQDCTALWSWVFFVAIYAVLL